jgi:hypothetical protein
LRIRGHLDEVHIAAAGFDHEQAVQTLETARSAQSSRCCPAAVSFRIPMARFRIL